MICMYVFTCTYMYNNTYGHTEPPKKKKKRLSFKPLVPLSLFLNGEKGLNFFVKYPTAETSYILCIPYIDFSISVGGFSLDLKLGLNWACLRCEVRGFYFFWTVLCVWGEFFYCTYVSQKSKCMGNKNRVYVQHNQRSKMYVQVYVGMCSKKFRFMCSELR